MGGALKVITLATIFCLWVFLTAAHGSHKSSHAHSCPAVHLEEQSDANHQHSSQAHRHEHHDDLSHHHKFLLPEEIAEEEDLKLLHASTAHLDGSADRLSTTELWLHAMGSAFLVSVASLVCLALVAVTGGRSISPLLVDSLAAFGGGAMMGDAFLHQLPHAFGKQVKHEHEHSHLHDEEHGAHSHSMEDLCVGLSILGGIILFFLIEKIVRYVEAQSNHRHHHHHHVKEKKDDPPENEKDTTVTNTDGKKEERAASHSYSQIPVLGLLNLLTDGVHNFTDGIALGAAFLAYGKNGGWYRAWFLLCHELPQEVGDFGILVRSGFSALKALAFNFLSALLAMVGAAMVLAIGAEFGNSSLIEGFTAGGFLYISLAGVLPEMHQQGTSLRCSAAQVAALSCGIGAAIVISLNE